MRSYLVGGAVRDILLGRRPREFDIAFDGETAEFLRRHKGKVRTVGKNLPVYIVGGCEHAPLHGGTIAADLANRDLTINALALDENGILHTLPESLRDLAEGVLRHASPGAFAQDCARILRTARFYASLPGFRIHPETLRLMREAALTPGYTAIAAERAGKECMKAMEGHKPGNFLRVLRDTDALLPWLAPMEKALFVPAGPPSHHGGKSVFDHTCDVMDAAAATAFREALSPKHRALAAWMALCHDLGKMETDADKLPRHIGHENRGLLAAESLVAGLRLPTRWGKAARLAITLHMKAGRYKELRLKTRVEMLHALHASGLFLPFCALVTADSGDESLSGLMQRDMELMLAVTLPPEWRNMGAKSAAKLLELRIGALPGKDEKAGLP